AAAGAKDRGAVLGQTGGKEALGLLADHLLRAGRRVDGDGVGGVLAAELGQQAGAVRRPRRRREPGGQERDLVMCPLVPAAAVGIDEPEVELRPVLLARRLLPAVVDDLLRTPQRVLRAAVAEQDARRAARGRDDLEVALREERVLLAAARVQQLRAVGRER